VAQGKPKGETGKASKGGLKVKAPKDLKPKFKSKVAAAAADAAGAAGVDRPASSATQWRRVRRAKIARALTTRAARVAGAKKADREKGRGEKTEGEKADGEGMPSGKNLGKRRRAAAKRQQKREERGLVKAVGGGDGDDEGNADKPDGKAEKPAKKTKKTKAEDAAGRAQVRAPTNPTARKKHHRRRGIRLENENIRRRVAACAAPTRKSAYGARAVTRYVHCLAHRRAYGWP